MLRKRIKRTFQVKTFIKVNHLINYPSVRVLTEKGEMLGVMPTTEAMAKARAEEKDLVLVTDKSQPPITKIIELSKYKYQLQQKQAEGRKKARAQDTKEVRFSPFIGENDLMSKIKKVIGFLQKGHKTKLTLSFRGRQIAQKDQGYAIFHRIFDATKEVGEVELEPKMMGMKLITQLMPIKKK